MPRPAPVPLEKQGELVSLYLEGVSRNSLAIQFNASRRFVTDCLRRHGVQVRGPRDIPRAMPLNEGAFDGALDNEEAAYWIGFLMADGCIAHTPHSRYVILQLSSKDADHVRAFRAFLGSEHRIAPIRPGIRHYGKHAIRTGECVRFAVASSRLVDRLATFGVVPHKSTTARVFLLENDRHFWRGMVDGDGTVRLAARKGGVHKARPTISLVGSHAIIHQFRDYVLRSLGHTSTPYFSKGCWNVAYVTKPAIDILKLLYGDCGIALPRKRDVAWSITATSPGSAGSVLPGPGPCPGRGETPTAASR